MALPSSFSELNFLLNNTDLLYRGEKFCTSCEFHSFSSKNWNYHSICVHPSNILGKNAVNGERILRVPLAADQRAARETPEIERCTIAGNWWASKKQQISTIASPSSNPVNLAEQITKEMSLQETLKLLKRASKQEASNTSNSGGVFNLEDL